ncbi:MAG TPA: amino acid deaminase/aldolase [Actinomycetales bacterium]|nr:amino acid deaminase/aldolase [Actinomycetales bacterium]
MSDWSVVEAATRVLQPPFAAVDLSALRANAADLVRRGAGVPIRVATKSVRCRAVLDLVLAEPGFSGLMAYSLAEALWLVGHGASDVLVAYPTVDRASLRRLVADPLASGAVTVMVDDPGQVDLIEKARAEVGAGTPPTRVCLDVDASLRVGPLHIGVRRSPVHTPAQAESAARHLAERAGVRLVGVMVYDAQIAGLQDSSAAIRVMKRLSARELRRRRSAVVQALSRHAELEIVNGGGTGSLDVVSGAPGLTELAAGSGLYGPALFDGYRDFTPRPALAFALPVTRRPAAGIRTLFSGGYVASGAAGADRLPRPFLPRGLQLLPAEGAGEVQTPVSGPGAARLGVGDRVWFRHAKAGEVCERFNELHLVAEDGTATTVPTYRGEGQCFG